MKHTLFLFTLLPLFAIAQTKKDNTIITHAEVSKITETLFNNGFILESGDKTFCATKSMNTFDLRICFLISDSSVSVRGYIKMQTYMQSRYTITESSWYPVRYGAMKTSPMYNAWKEMDKISKLLSDSVTYVKI